MGKNKTPSSSKSNPPPPAATSDGVDFKKQNKKAKGHRQRGAGTIITAPPPVTTKDGITLAPHMRLPTTLLQEYCQKEKKPKPVYDLCGAPSKQGETRTYQFKVRVLDGKNSRNDLLFRSNQSCESEKVAKDYCALLALFHLQPLLPLERKLPEPFRTTWLDMVATAAQQKQSKSGTKGNQAIRNKGATTAAPSNGTPTSTNTSTEECSTSKEEGESNNSGSGTNGVVPLVGLKNAQRFTSESEKRQAEHRRKARRAPDESYAEALLAANRPQCVDMTPDMRRELLRVLGPNHDEGAGEGEDEIVFRALKEAGEGMLSVLGSQTLDDGVDMLFEMIKKVVSHLLEVGFTQKDAERSCRASLTGSLNEALALSKKGKKVDLLHLLKTASLEHLCVTLDESALPEVVAAERHDRRRKFDVIVPSAKERDTKTVQRNYPSATVVALTRPMEENGVTVTDVVRRLTGFGWSHDCCVRAAHLAHRWLMRSSGGESGLEPGTLSSSVFFAALETLCRITCDVSFCSVTTPFEDTPTRGFDVDSYCEVREEELESLSAIYDTDLSVSTSTVIKGDKTNENVTVIEISLSCDSVVPVHLKSWLVGPGSSLRLEVRIHSSVPYPAVPPLVCLRAQGLESEFSVGCLALLRLQKFLSQKAMESVEASGGDVGVIYELASAVDEWLESETAGCQEDIGPLSMKLIEDTLKEIEMKTLGDVTVADEHSTGEDSLDEDKVDTEREATDGLEKKVTSDGGERKGNAKTENEKKTRDFSSYHPFFTRSSISSSRLASTVASSKMMLSRQKLPAWRSKDEFLSRIANTTAMVVTGETGCGKTTQIPQFILDEYASAKVVVCQPRRLAAVGVASRVAAERECELGKVVGYSVRGRSEYSRDTQLLFCTYGILLKRLQIDPLLGGVDFVVLDEVHERGMESDFVLSILLRVMRQRESIQYRNAAGPCPLRVVVMSATIQTERFASYLGADGVPCPVLHIPGFTYPVEEFFLDDFEREVYTGGPKKSEQSQEEDDIDDEEESSNVTESITTHRRRKRGDINYDLIVRLIVRLCKAPKGRNGDSLRHPEGSILVFLPGVGEISKLISQLCEAPEGANMRILPLHGSLSNSDQRKVFETPPRGVMKVVVATNVAEASITIEDTTVIIDSCKVKEMTTSHTSKMSSLVTVMASRDSLRQRSGRAGRVKAGRCFRLISRATYDKEVPMSSVPEMLRVPVERLVLHLKVMTQTTNRNRKILPTSSSYDILLNCLDPPTENAIRSAENSLSCIGALDEYGNIAPLGTHLSSLPCDAPVGKMLIYGALLQCVEPVAAVAACISSRDPFLASLDEGIKLKVSAAKKKFVAAISSASSGRAKKIYSDHLIGAEAIKQFRLTRNSPGDRARKSFCYEHGMVYDRLLELATVQRELITGLKDIGFVSSSVEKCLSDDCPENCNSFNSPVVVAAICAGLYPSVCKIIRPPKRFAETMGGSLEKDVDAHELRFFVPTAASWGLENSIQQGMGRNDEEIDSGRSFVKIKGPASRDAERQLTSDMIQARLHSSSALDGINSFGSNYLIYGGISMGGAYRGVRCVLRDVSEVSGYALLFFGGSKGGTGIQAHYTEGTASVDNWIRFSLPGRVVALINSLRKRIDQLLAEKIVQPDMDIQGNEILEVLVTLLSCDGVLTR